jgi:hypothetical protein
VTYAPELPARMRRLPRDKHGRVVPWFVAIIDGVPDHRIVGTGKLEDAVKFRICWLCGIPLGANVAFVLGPMCTVNRVSAEPPSHRECALYAAQVCPFLTTPGMRRRDARLPAGAVEPDGVMIRRNPGVAAVWVTRRWRMQPGLRLFDLGDPAVTLWFAEGRAATRSEVEAALESGLPLLRTEAEQDPRPDAALAELERQHTRALELLPAQ